MELQFWIAIYRQQRILTVNMHDLFSCSMLPKRFSDRYKIDEEYYNLLSWASEAIVLLLGNQKLFVKLDLTSLGLFIQCLAISYFFGLNYP